MAIKYYVKAAISEYTDQSGQNKKRYNTIGIVTETKKGDLVGLTQAMGPYTAKVSYGKTNTDVKAYNAGVDYNLSKRTAVGVAYRVVDRVGTTTDVKSVGVGITHLF